LQGSANASLEPDTWLCAESTTTLHRVVRNWSGLPTAELWSGFTWNPVGADYLSGLVIQRKTALRAMQHFARAIGGLID